MGNRCQVCGYETGDVIPPLGKHDKHIFQYYNTSREHWCECVCGKQINARSEHSWGDWILDKEATEKSKGSKHHICLVCHYREDKKLQKKRHAHGSFYSGDEYDHSFRQMNQRQHGRVCDDPECGQYYDIEAHTFTEWEITGFPDWYTDGSMKRVCAGCGYTQTKKIGKWGSDRKRIIVVEHGKSTKTTSLCRYEDTPTLTAEERPGYVFSGWTCDFCFHNKADGYLHMQNVALLNPTQYAYQGKTDVIKVDDPTAETMTVLDIPQQLKNLALPHELKNEDECYFAFTANYTRIPVRVLIWPENSSRHEDRIMIEPGYGYDCRTGTVKSGRLGTHLYLEEIEVEDPGVNFPYEYVLHMNGYEGGPIKILPPDLDYSVNCKVAVSIEDWESVIRSKAGKGCGIEVNSLNGGEFTMYSENGGKLTIDVESGSGLDNSGIEVVDTVGRTSMFLNHANLNISVANLSKPSPRFDNSAAGIRAGDVRIWGGDISIDVHAPHLANELAAVGIEAESSIDIDSPALRIDVTDVDVGAGGTGVGINAKGAEISMLTAKYASDWYEDEDIELLGEDENMEPYAAGIFVNYPDGGAIRFTMPDWDVTPIAEFGTDIISLFDFALDGSDPAMTADHRIGKADVSFRVEIPAEFAPGAQLEADAVLECSYLNEEGELVWCDRETEPANRYSYLAHDAVAYDQGKKTASFHVSDTVYLADIVPTELTPGDWKRIYESPDRSYRLRVTLSTYDGSYSEWCTWVTNPFELSWNKPFTVDVDGEGRNPEIVIPSGDVGAAFAIDFSKYVSGGSGSYHYSVIPAVQPVPMEFTFNEDRGSFCFFHTESSVGMNYADNVMQIQDKLTGEMALVYFDVMPTLNTQMYDTYVGGVRVSAYNRADVLGDGRVSYTPAEGGKPAKLTLSGVTLDAGYCGSRNPAVYGDNAFAAVFTREDLEIVAEGSNRIVLDENSEAAGDPYVQDSLIAGIYGFGANVTLSGGGELNIQSHRGFCLEEDEGKRGGSFTLNDCGLTLNVTRGNVLGKSGSEGFIYADGRFTARSAQDSDATLLNGVGFADGARENAVLLLSAGTDMENAQPGSPDMLAAQQPGSLYHLIRIQPTGRTEAAPIADGLVSEPSGEVYVVANESAKGAGVMKAIVAVYEKDTGRFLKLWVGELDPAEPLTATGLTVDESNSCRIMVLDGDTWRPLTGSRDF